MVGIMKNKKFFAVVVLMAVTALGYARRISGCVESGKKVLKEVLVTDGYSITPTDNNGQYSLEANDSAEFVYIVTPKGYTADFSSGVPQFYLRLEPSKSTYDFNLKPLGGNPDNFTMITMADTQIDSPEDIQRLNKESLPDILHTISEYKDTPAAGIILGDITWDRYAMNEDIKDFNKKLAIPVYPVIGNHDFDKYMNPCKGCDFAHIYKENFGPLYYAFQMGNVFYIVLSDIVYHGHKQFDTSLETANQMRWLELLLTVLQQDKTVVIAMHAPLKYTTEAPLIPGGEQLVKMLVNKFHAHFITGHLHTNANTEIGGGIIEHNLGAVCGTWWTCDYCRDGAPNGYQVFQGYGDNLSWYYKSTGKDRKFQMTLYPQGSIMDRPNAVVAKVWNWDDAWKVQWYEDDKFMGAMSQFYSYDPEYLKYLNGRRAVEDYDPPRTLHFFSAVPSLQAKEVKVEVVDRFGNVFTEKVNCK